MKDSKNHAEAGVKKKIASVHSEQGATKDVGAKAPKSYGHDSAKSEGVGGSIPNES